MDLVVPGAMDGGIATEAASGRNDPISFLPSTPRGKYDLDDWLRLHGLTGRQCRDILSRSSMLEIGRASSAPSDLSARDAWAEAASAIDTSLPELRHGILAVRDGTVLVFEDACPRPMTFRGSDGRIVVAMRYRTTARDVLTLAHEFGHALQTYLTGGQFVVPILREIAAFRAELALLAHLAKVNPVLHRSASVAWAADNQRYAARHGAALAQALEVPESRYIYDWNYPIARVLASECDGLRRREIERAIFLNGVTVPALAKFLGCSHNTSTTCSGACLGLNRLPSGSEGRREGISSRA